MANKTTIPPSKSLPGAAVDRGFDTRIRKDKNPGNYRSPGRTSTVKTEDQGFNYAPPNRTKWRTK